jgi:hypothetical protein
MLSAIHNIIKSNQNMEQLLKKKDEEERGIYYTY